MYRKALRLTFRAVFADDSWHDWPMLLFGWWLMWRLWHLVRETGGFSEPGS